MLVGALHGSLYALPADHLMLAASPTGVDPDSSSGAASAPAAVVWPKKAGRMALDITPAVVDMCAAAGPVAAGKQQLPVSRGDSGGAAGAEGGSGGVSPNGSNEGGSSSSALALLDEFGEAGSGVVALNPADNGAPGGGGAGEGQCWTGLCHNHRMAT